jgi:hypothetical protein
MNILRDKDMNQFHHFLFKENTGSSLLKKSPRIEIRGLRLRL